MDLVQKRIAGTIVLSPSGRIDHATAEEFKASLAPHVARCAAGQDRLVLDFTAIEYISRAGLRVLMLAATQAKAQGGAPAAAAREALVRAVFELSRVALLMKV